MANEGCSKEQLHQLAHSVRVKGLSPLHCVLPSFAWFTSCSGWALLPSLLQLRDTAADLVDDGSWSGMGGWLAPVRTGASKPASIGLSLDLGEAQLKELYELRCQYSTPVFVNGFYLRLKAYGKLAGAAAAAAKGAALRMGIECDEHATEEGLRLCLPKRAMLTVRAAYSVVKGTETACKGRGFYLAKVGGGFAWWGGRGATMELAVAPLLLHEGALHWRGSIEDVL